MDFGLVAAGMDEVEAIAAVSAPPRSETGVTDGSMNSVPVGAIVVMTVRAVE